MAGFLEILMIIMVVKGFLNLLFSGIKIKLEITNMNKVVKNYDLKNDLKNDLLNETIMYPVFNPEDISFIQNYSFQNYHELIKKNMSISTNIQENQNYYNI
jgi:hypothetical protein